MTLGNRINCRLCGQEAERFIGFSAPMGLPGEESINLNTAIVHVFPPKKGEFAFSPVAELEGDLP